MKTNTSSFVTNDLKLNNGNLTEMTLTELQEIAIRQQQQIEINQQLLLAKEKRLKLLKIEDQKNQQLTMLSNNITSLSAYNLQQPQHKPYSKTIENANKLENLKQSVLGQELKIFKLKELRNQIIKHKLSNSNMNSELELIKSLFSKKERELCDAIKNVSELTKQIDQLKKIKSISFNQTGAQMLNKTNSNVCELEKLKQELQIRNKLNEQQAKKIMQQHELFNQKQFEVLSLDKRIEELQNRIATKRSQNETLAKESEPEPPQEPNQSHASPSKATAKFATKQEIANTYMNKYGSETFQKYQQNSIKILKQQLNKEEQQQQQIEKPSEHSQANNNLGFQIDNQIDSSSFTALPSHLKLEFDKLKYLPDMVKTIKKRHSISEVEGSGANSTMIPPLIFQKMLEKHHKNFLDQKVQQKLNQIKETPTDTNQENKQEEPEQPVESKSDPELEQIEPVKEAKQTKPIIKPTNERLNSIYINNTNSKRVNFDPHALLLDAAVEGELDLVVKCAQLVTDISEPNDEGITALHNSVCAGHFDIVKFLVEFGCDINFADNDGWTPLHCAASCNNLPMVKFLIQHGASVFATTVSDNETSIKKCEEDEEGYEACYEYLLNAQKNLGDKSFNNSIVHALYSYEAENDDELTFKSGDELVVLDKHEVDLEDEENDGWWTAKLVNDSIKQGLVPNNYIGLFPRVKASRTHQESTVC